MARGVESLKKIISRRRMKAGARGGILLGREKQIHATRSLLGQVVEEVFKGKEKEKEVGKE